ncbi:hypothetical protein CLONEX_01349 [[Clostridium] nexile DSM 1787]|nr:hypothetical protein CLONEX_01349 [[Clostridium] nexile DSM 1787]
MRIVERISIHTPAKGVTDSTSSRSNPTHISIHTPAKGVTKRKRQGD